MVIFLNYFSLQNLIFLNLGKFMLQIILPKLPRMAYFKTSKH